MLYANPLEAYLDSADVDRKAIFSKFNACGSTGCGRSYVAFWELRNDSLFLKKVVCCNDWDSPTSPSIDLERLFGSRYKNNEVFADWVTGELIHPHGKQLKYIHQGYESIYAYEKGFVIKNGNLEKINSYDNSKTRESKFRKNNHFQFLYENINWTLIEEQHLGAKHNVIVQFTTDEHGHPTKTQVMKGLNPLVDAEAIRVVALFPEWDVTYRHGKLVPVKWNLKIGFDKTYYEMRLDAEKKE